MSINTEGGFFQGCAKKGGFNPGGVLSWGGSFLPPIKIHRVPGGNEGRLCSRDIRAVVLLLRSSSMYRTAGLSETVIKEISQMGLLISNCNSV